MKKTIVSAIAALAVSMMNAASANFLYDVNITGGYHYQFTEPSILTSSATVTSFLLTNPNNISSAIVAPDVGDDCFPGVPTGAPFEACISTTFSFGGGAFITDFTYFLTSIETTGTFNAYTASGAREGVLTITNLATVPEPSPLLLFVPALVASLILRRRSMS